MKPADLKPFPTFASDQDAERFVETADLSAYDLSGFRPTTFEFGAKDARVTLRMPAPLLAAVKRRAAQLDMPYQRFIRDALERALR